MSEDVRKTLSVKDRLYPGISPHELTEEQIAEIQKVVRDELANRPRGEQDEVVGAPNYPNP